MTLLKSLRAGLMLAVGAVIWLFFTVGIHEAGHVFAAKMLTKDVYEIDSVQIWPSLQLYPRVQHLATSNDSLGDTYVTLIGRAEPMAQMNTLKPQLGLPPDKNPQRLAQRLASHPEASHQTIALDAETLNRNRELADQNVIRLMGAVTTGFVSLAALVCIVCFDLRGITLVFASALALLHLDALLYAIVPTVFGLPHLFVAGGTESEPVSALAHFGVNAWWTCTVFALLSILQIGILVNHWKKQGEN